ncbi:hypothetical protein ACFSDD_09060 [Salipiger marinus]|uniref:hypothetical protein n=1 Tax=Salipiger marinus TaxID=555512 RepID=UPI002B5DF2DC|nr:hypothetical protein [Salipiger manganoxidans]MEB3421912.1 hypothetical protein [Salipiger manganoxidans]
MSALETARAAWGAAIPDWIETLARECDRTSQNQVAQRLGRSASLVSNVLRNKYGAGLEAVEDVVRGALMAETFDCPVLGEIGKQKCRFWRARARTFENVNSQAVTMYRACNRCPRHIGADPLTPKGEQT